MIANDLRNISQRLDVRCLDMETQRSLWRAMDELKAFHDNCLTSSNPSNYPAS